MRIGRIISGQVRKKVGISFGAIMATHQGLGTLYLDSLSTYLKPRVLWVDIYNMESQGRGGVAMVICHDLNRACGRKESRGLGLESANEWEGKGGSQLVTAI